MNDKQGFWFVVLFVFLSRLPFLLPGFGSEEDAWGLFYIARKVATTGLYEVSRLPGHPLQEAVYILLWKKGALAFNLLTALFSTAATGFFMAALKKLKVPNPLVAGVVFAFIPVVYINSCNAMDYLWAMAFLMAAFYLVAGRQSLAAGICIGLAAGCRITSLAMALPLLFLLYDSRNRGASLAAVMKLTAFSALVAGLCYLPVINEYGLSFFGYTAQIPVSPAKAVFVATVGVWGVIGLADMVFAWMLMIWRRDGVTPSRPDSHTGLVRCAIAAVLIYTIAFIWLPQKAAFFIPALPFVVALLALRLRKQFLVALSFSMIFSSFFLGLNLDDDTRGVTRSTWSYAFYAAGKPLAIDVLRGPVIAERVKRINKIEYSEKILDEVSALKKKSVVIAGFWSSDVLAKADSLPRHVRLVYYVPEDSLAAIRQRGEDIYFVPGQEAYNDRAFNGRFTTRYALTLDVD